MKNKLSDLNNHLFAQMERLSDEDITQDQLEHELERSKAMTNISKEIISNARLILDAQTRYDEFHSKQEVPKLLT